MKTISRIVRIAAPLAFAGLLGLAACSSEPEHEQADEPTNQVDDQNVGDVPVEPAPAAPVILNETPPANVAVAAPVDTVAEDQQVQEDADASGMTSRLPSDEQPVEPAKESVK